MSRQRKTITYGDVESLYESGLEILLKRGCHPKGYYGTYDPGEIRIYLPKHKSEEEINHTILHEFGHAIEGIRGFKSRLGEKEIEEIVEKTLRKRPDLPGFIKQLHGLNY